LIIDYWDTRYSILDASAFADAAAVKRAGGRVTKDADGQDFFAIAVRKPRPTKLEQCWQAGPVVNSKFTQEEIAQIKVP